MQVSVNPASVPAGSTATVSISGGTPPYQTTAQPMATVMPPASQPVVRVDAGAPSGTVVTIQVTDSSTPPITVSRPLNVS